MGDADSLGGELTTEVFSLEWGEEKRELATYWTIAGARSSMMGGCYAVYMGTKTQSGTWGATPADGQWVDTDSCLADVTCDWFNRLVVDLL